MAVNLLRLAIAWMIVLVVCGCDAAVAEDEPDSLQVQIPSLAAAEPALVTEGVITRAVDGNSLDAHVGGHRTLVGYLGAETPLATQPCGPDALARNRELAGRRVYLEDDASYPFDERGRRLFYAYTEDGVSIDAVLIGEGLAHAVRTDGRYGAYLALLQAEAEAAGRGCLWGGAATP
jgi:endonuclease YncB( thermonuclease family)